MDDSSSRLPRPSGIPRPSNLPRPSSRLPLPKTSSIPTPPKPAQRSLLRPAASTERLRTKSPNSSLNVSAATIPRASSAAGRSSLSTGLRSPVKDDHVFKRPAVRPESRQARSRVARPTNGAFSMNTSVEHEDDLLGDLEGFRVSSMSRQGFRDDESDFGIDEDEGSYQQLDPKPRKPSSSLSERAIESLSHILPTSPNGSRSSSFFGAPTSPMGPPSRPASAMSRSRPDSRTGARPSSRTGMFRSSSQRRPTTPTMGPTSSGYGHTRAPSTTRPASLTSSDSNTLAPTFQRRSASAAPRSPAITYSESHASTIEDQEAEEELLKSPSGRLSKTPQSGSGSMIRNVSKIRPGVGSAFGDLDTGDSGTVRKAPPSIKKAAPAVPTVEPDAERKAPTSSSALREQIAKAKAARKAALSKQTPAKDDTPVGGSDFGSYEDPFNQLPKGGEAVINKRVATARSEGRLNLANMGLNEIPKQVMTMYEYDPNNSVSTWAETVDLVRFIAADNEIETLPDELFPDIDPLEASEDFDANPNQFGGVEFLDLHGNILKELPIGLRRLEHLTALNLSRNRLRNDSLEIISQISSLRDLKLADNDLEGAFPDSVGRLENLEVLELQGNRINQLPDELQTLVNLRLLNVASNQLSSLPMEVLQSLPLVELVASKNALRGKLFPATVSEMRRLQTLNVSGNALTALSESQLSMPELRTLNASINRLEGLPDMSLWTNLITLLAEENKLSELPSGFTALMSLKHANFSGNDVTKIDPEVGLMKSLEGLNLAANPLSERKFLTMVTEDLKRALKSRITTAGHDDDEALADASKYDNGGSGAVQKESAWTLRGSGILDLSSKDLTELDEENFAEVADGTRQIILRQNHFTSIPAIVSLANSLTLLDFSHNRLTDIFTEPLELPYLRDLRLSSNKLATFDTLLSYLSAPRLEHLDLTANRLSGTLPALPSFYPSLTTLLAADNAITDISAEALSSLHAANLSNNSIGRVPPEIGLLWDQGLRALELEGNTFRVPNYTVLRKGTQEVMRWLRDKIPREVPEEEDETF